MFPPRTSLPTCPLFSVQRVRVRIPKEKKVKGVKLLSAEKLKKVKEEQGYLTVVVPSVLVHEVVAIDLETRKK